MKKFAVFDIDGTLIRWQLYHTLVDRLAKNGALGAGSFEKFNQARMRWKRREGLEDFRQYELLLVNTFEEMLHTINPELLDQLVIGVISEYRDQTYRYTRELFQKLKDQDYFLIAISGSHHELVSEMAKYYKFDDWAGSKYERKNGKFTGKKMIASQIKKEILTEMIKRHNLTFNKSYAIGDSKGDAGVLELVENPIAFNPDQNLYKLAANKGWKIVIERKNMIYHLEQNNGLYRLVQTN